MHTVYTIPMLRLSVHSVHQCATPFSLMWYKVKTNASMLQKKIVPWLIAFGGLRAIKKITLDHAKQMVIAILDREHLLSYASAAEAAVDFPVAFADVVRKVKAAAGTTQASFSECARSRACPAALPVIS